MIVYQRVPKYPEVHSSITILTMGLWAVLIIYPSFHPVTFPMFFMGKTRTPFSQWPLQEPKYGLIWYSTSFLESWISHWFSAGIFIPVFALPWHRTVTSWQILWILHSMLVSTPALLISINLCALPRISTYYMRSFPMFATVLWLRYITILFLGSLSPMIKIGCSLCLSMSHRW